MCVEVLGLFVHGARRGAMRLTLLVQRFVKTTLYKLLRLIFVVVQRICWELNGTAQKLRETRLPHNYDRSAQVLDVVLFNKFCTVQSTIDNTWQLLVHSQSLREPAVHHRQRQQYGTLMTITERDAVFCETKEKGRPLHTTEGRPINLAIICCLYADIITTVYEMAMSYEFS